ncbi:hypothetical protein SESI111939_22685 [Serratia silvae]
MVPNIPLSSLNWLHPHRLAALARLLLIIIIPNSQEV